MEDLLRTVEGGCALRLRVVPGSSRARVVGRHGHVLKVAVRAPPERGRANKEVVAVLAAALDVPVRDIELTSGLASRDKTVLVRRPPDDVRKRLVPLLS